MSAAVSYDSYPFIVHDFFAESLHVLRWPSKKSLTEWAQENAYISADGNAEPGRFRPYPFQIGIMDAMTDPKTERTSIMKSARVGYTTMIGHLIGYHMDHDPCPIMMVQPTIDMAEDYSKNDFECMVRDVDCLAKLINTVAKNRGRSTLSFKVFPGGTLRIIGANSPTGFRKVSIRVIIFDEVDGYPIEAGQEGAPMSLGIKRTETFWNRKIIAGSTPTGDNSDIARLFEEGDQRRYYVPCPMCGHMHVLEMKNMHWPEGRPQEAWFECPECEGKITHDKKIWMVERGEWIAARPFEGHASFHIWAAYSYSPNATWGHIAQEFVTAQKKGARFFKTFVNTWLGEVWKEATESPDWNLLYSRREPYQPRIVPAQARLITAGTDVQKDRIEVEVVAWGPGLESWTLDYQVFEGDTADIEGPAWQSLYELMSTQFESESGIAMPITRLAVDANYHTQHVVNWCRRYGGSRAVPIKGDHKQVQIIRQPRPVDVYGKSGKRKRHGARLWFVGVSHIKRELYGWYRLPVPSESNPVPGIGYCHFGDFLDEHYFRMITAEELVRIHKKNGMASEEWHLPSGRRNEALDCRVYNRAMAYLCGMDNLQREGEPARKGNTRPQVERPEEQAPQSMNNRRRQPPPRRRNSYCMGFRG